MPYNPFDKKPLDQLTRDDLQKLVERQVAEGYYVEYKGDTFPANTKIGHSIGSFANTYGGWYIVGVRTDAHNVATDICGFELGTYPDPISKVREVVKSHLDPVPVFFPQVVDIGGGRAALVVYIPPDQEMPFISKDGRIYRRVHDSSDPVPEASRYAVDRLYEEGRKAAKRFERFCQDERILSKAEAEDISWLNIYLSPHPLGAVEKFKMDSASEVEEVLRMSQALYNIPIGGAEALQGNLPFNVAQPTLGSIILQQIEPSKAAFNSLSVELFSNGRAKFLIPLQFIPDLARKNLSNVESAEARDTLQALFDTDFEDNTQYLRFFDVGKLMMMLVVLMGFYKHWLGDDSPVTDVKAAIEINNAWRVVPFSDDDEWGKYVKKFGLPVMKTGGTRIPVEPGKGFVFSMKDAKYAGQELGEVIGLAFGLPVELAPHALHRIIVKGIKAGTHEGGKVISKL